MANKAHGREASASAAPRRPVIPLSRARCVEAGVTRNSPYPEEEDTDMTRWPEQGAHSLPARRPTPERRLPELMDDIIGTVEVGKFADLVVLDTKYPGEVDPGDLSAKVVYTISDGCIVSTRGTEQKIASAIRNGAQTLEHRPRGSAAVISPAEPRGRPCGPLPALRPHANTLYPERRFSLLDSHPSPTQDG